MPTTIDSNRSFLEPLATTKGKYQKKALLEAATPGQLRALCECIRNIWKGRFKLTTDQRDKLLAHRNILSQLATY